MIVSYNNKYGGVVFTLDIVNWNLIHMRIELLKNWSLVRMDIGKSNFIYVWLVVNRNVNFVQVLKQLTFYNVNVYVQVLKLLTFYNHKY
jgi:hypothetical protein